MKKFTKNLKFTTVNSTKNLNKLFLLIPLFLLSFSLFITCIKLIQKEATMSSSIKMDTEFSPENQNIMISAQDNQTVNTVTISTNDSIINKNNIKKLQSNLAKNIIRLHVIANSDSDEDQSLKYKVRNTIIEKLRSSLTDITDKEQAEKTIATKLTDIEQAASRTINENGYSYSVNATICNRDFPVKTYGDLTFPAGEYRSLCIEIGKAEGKNWWCVLFPSLCFVNDTTAVVPKSSKEQLRTEIGEKDYLELEEYSKAINETSADNAEDEQPDLEVHSALYDWICNKLH